MAVLSGVQYGGGGNPKVSLLLLELGEDNTWVCITTYFKFPYMDLTTKQTKNLKEVRQ